MSKKLLIGALALCLSLGLSACGSSSESSTITLTMGAGHTVDSMAYLQVADSFFIPEVTARVAAETDYEVEWSQAYGTVVSLTETVTGCQDGLVDFCMITTSPVTGQLPYNNFGIYLPFSCADNGTMLAASKQLYTEFADEMLTPLEEDYNQKLLSVLMLDSYEIFSSTPILTVDDLDGLKIGGSGSNLFWLENTGAVAVQSNLSDGYTSLQTGLIDGQFTAPDWGINYNYQDICSYMTDIGLNSTAGVIMTVNLDTWNDLPEEVQVIIEEVSAEFEQEMVAYTDNCRAEAYEQCEELGVEITYMTDEAKAEWLALLPNLPDTAAAELGSTGLQILERYIEILEEDFGLDVPRDWEFNY